MEELSNRGHTTTYLTRDSQVKFGKKFPSIETVSLSNDTKHGIAFKALSTDSRKRTLPVLSAKLLKIVGSTFEEDYKETVQFFKSKNMDVAICDHFTVSCQEACHTLQIPFLVTSSIGAAPDTEAPYIDNSIKLFNTAFGFESARPLGPLVEFIGPIVPKSAASKLTQDLDHFLVNHQRVACIAFGQHATTNETELTALFAGLLEAYEIGYIDGMIWSIRGLDGIIPSVIVTSSNPTYHIHQLLNQNKLNDIAFLQWAPQTAFLQHPSTILFVTHAGAGSLYEGLQAGKRLVFLPLFFW
ncbi:C2 domain-containing protein [Mucor velutinosus]|uniref:C2 domain-containing protein n=1 Tax=Mucor velutinosus TaxID=708070 RepID=A0AAN7DK75_9FUNG|nr:C2 domain-containing protein [Mucor velutinosus]